jgi:acyl-coenzyme A thioesterase PaaI-like protein
VPDYPPPRHLLRDLRVSVSSDAGTDAVRAACVPGVCGADGAARASFFAALVDVACGRTGARRARPGTVVTQDLAVHVLAPLRDGEAIARVHVLRDSRHQLRFDSEVSDASGQPVARASMTSAKREQASPHRQALPGPGQWLDFARPGSGLAGSLAEYAGLRVVDAHCLAFERTPALCNGLGILHGAAQAIVLEAAAEHAAREATGRAVATSDLSIQFLEAGRSGPFRARAELLRESKHAGLLRVELLDTGDGGARVALGWVGVTLL